jgi:CheY-like chemotaxis protein
MNRFVDLAGVTQTLPRVMLVERDSLVCRSFERMTRQLIHLQTVASAEQAFELAAGTGWPELLIAAFRLPGLDGLTFLKQVKREHPEVTVALSSGGALQPGADSGIVALPKPVNLFALQSLIASLTSNRAK